IVIVKTYSEWPETVQMDSASISATISALTKIFAQFGNCRRSSRTMACSLSQYCAMHSALRSPPFNAQSSGQVGRLMDSFKSALVKLKGNEPMIDVLCSFLMAFRSTPCPPEPNQASPAENFLRRRLRTVFDLMLSTVDNSVGPRDIKMEKQFNRHYGTRRCHSEVGDAVCAKDYRRPKSTWTSGTIVRRTGNTTYAVHCGKLLWTRHINQLR
ncbi:Uncharacterized protein K02A2.6, partial [Toxocara canis]